MRVLVTGGTGFVGKYLVRMLLEQDYEVVCLVRHNSKAAELKDLGVDLIYGDITRKETLQGISENVDYVIHMAAKGVVEAVSEQAYREFLGMNEEGTQNLLEEFKGSKQLKKFIHFSSTAAMGLASEEILDEDTKVRPETPYQKSKWRSEEIVVEAFEKHGIPAVVLRPCMIYGIGSYKGEYLKFCKIMKKGIFPKVGRGLNLTPMVYVTDVAKAAVLALENGLPGSTYIISDSTSYPLDEFRNMVVKCLDIKTTYFYVPKGLALAGAKAVEGLAKLLKKTPIVTYRNMKSTVNNRTFDISKARRELHFEPEIDMYQGTEMTIKWYVENKLL